MKLEFNKISIIQILFLSFFIRVVAAYFFADQKIENEWGVLVHNLSVSGVLGINVALETLAIHRFAERRSGFTFSVYATLICLFHLSS